MKQKSGLKKTKKIELNQLSIIILGIHDVLGVHD